MFDYKKAGKAAVVGLAIGIVPALYLDRGIGKLFAFASNTLFFGGIALLIYGLFSLTLYLGLFNGTIYGFKVLFDTLNSWVSGSQNTQLQHRAEYDAEHKKGGLCREILAAAVLMLILSMLCALI